MVQSKGQPPARKQKTEGPAFQHEQSATLVDEIRQRADTEKTSRREPNELGQQPMHEPAADKKEAPTPQELRERTRKENDF